MAKVAVRTEITLDYQGAENLVVLACGACGAPLALTEAMQKELRRTHATFWCPNGHTRHYPAETEEERLRSALAEAQQLTNRWKATAENRQSQLYEALDILHTAQQTRNLLEKRVDAGVCTHCHRTFRQLARHMKSKHLG